jgi:hypothetical protein
MMWSPHHKPWRRGPCRRGRSAVPQRTWGRTARLKDSCRKTRRGREDSRSGFGQRRSVCRQDGPDYCNSAVERGTLARKADCNRMIHRGLERKGEINLENTLSLRPDGAGSNLPVGDHLHQKIVLGSLARKEQFQRQRPGSRRQHYMGPIQ